VSLVIHVAGDAESMRLQTGDVVSPGARIRFEVEGTRRGYVAIVGIDGSGATTVYYPFGANIPATFDPAVDRLLPGAIQLDATPGEEKFFAVFSKLPFVVDDTLPAIRGAGGLPEGVTSSEVVLHKK
jgi:hypothetical protein